MSYLVYKGNQTIIKTFNYTTNQGAHTHSQQQNLPFSKNFKMAFKHLSQLLLIYPCGNV